MKIIKFMAVGLLSLTVPAFAETIICSYPPYAQAESQVKKPPVVLEITVQGERAIVRSKVPPSDFRVLQNTKAGLVLANSFARKDDPNEVTNIGAFVLLIDRASGTFVRSNVVAGESWSAYTEGTCIFQQ